MTGGSLAPSNKIGRGYPRPLGLTGVEPAGRVGWRNFGREIERAELPIGRSAAQVPATAGMAENCGFSLYAWGVVAPISSHGSAFAPRSQVLSLDCRLIAGLTARDLAQLREPARTVARGRGPSPFRPAPGATRVASASRQIRGFSARSLGSSRPFRCLTHRPTENLLSRTNGSGPGENPRNPHNGVGGTGSLAVAADARNGSASRVDGALSGDLPAVEHGARGPFVERSVESCSRTAAAVNNPAQKSVDNAK